MGSVFASLAFVSSTLCTEAIQRLAGGRLDMTEIDPEEPKEAASSESDVLSVSLDDEDEYITMLDSIPLNSTTPEAVLQVMPTTTPSGHVVSAR